MNNQQNVFEALTPDVVIEAIEQQGYYSDGRCYPLNSYENRVYQVGLEEGGALIAKFYRPGRWALAEIEEEASLLAALSQAGLPVVAPLIGENGGALVKQAGFDVALYPKIIGQAPNLEDLDSLYAIGELVGRLHAWTEPYRFEARHALMPLEQLHTSANYLLECWVTTDQQADFRQIVAEIGMVLAEQAMAAQSLVIHGDLHLGNMLVADEITLLDFDDARMGFAIEDLFLLLSGTEVEQRQQLSEIVEGYEQHREFPRSELPMLHGLRAVRMVKYLAWIGRRWAEPVFQQAFPWYQPEDWKTHNNDLKQLLLAMDKPPLFGGQ